MRPSRLIYVENDPALRGIMSSIFKRRPEVDLILASGDPMEVLESGAAANADVALIDLALGVDVMNGLDLGIALREYNTNIGIVIHSQYPLDTMMRRVPESSRIGWSFLPKAGDMDMDHLVAVLRTTAQGIPVGEVAPADDPSGGLLEQLTQRQRAVMALAASGLSAPQIAQRLGVSHDTARQDLSKAYRILIPEAEAGDDLRTRAILAYLKMVREDAWNELPT